MPTAAKSRRGRPTIEAIQRSGRLTFVSRADVTKHGGRALYQCDCGKSVVTHIHRVNSGVAMSCGCLRKERSYQLHLESINPDETEGARLDRIRKESLRRAKQRRLVEFYEPRDPRLPTSGGMYGDWIRDEYARITMDGRKAQIVWDDDRIGLWAEPGLSNSRLRDATA
jgi:hypothetical protein